MSKSISVSHSAKHWQGKYWGESGAVCGGLFALLSTLYSAVKSAPSRRHQLLVTLGVMVLYVTIRTCYAPKSMSTNQLDVLASVGRKLGFRRHAIMCGELALADASKDMSFATYMLLLAGLMRDHDALYGADQPGSRAHALWMELRANMNKGEFNPPEQKIRVLRALAWFANKYPSSGKRDAREYAREALRLARVLGATDQELAVTSEFSLLLTD